MKDGSLSFASPDTASAGQIPLSFKLAYTAFMAVLIPYYLYAYGPGNFLWFCDVALIVTLIGLWRESRLLISTQAVAIVLPQLLWTADFFFQLAFGHPLIGLAAYMFNEEIPLAVRGLSLFHLWLPFVLVWLVHRVGYDHRALKAECLICWSVLLTAFMLLPSPNTEAGNVNKVFGWGETAQTMMPGFVWLGLLMMAYPLLVYVPSHLICRRVFRTESRSVPATVIA